MSSARSASHGPSLCSVVVRLLVAVVVLAAWAAPVRAQVPAEPTPSAYEICGTPELEGWAPEVQREAKRLLREKETLRAPGEPDAAGQASDTVGQQRSFWARNFATASYYQLMATCKKVGTHAYIYLENGRPLSDTVLNNIINQFDNTIYARDRELFGSEPNPGVDGDGRVYLLLLDIQDGYSGSGGYIAGYFSAGNEFDTGVFAYSNMKEMVYIDVYPQDPSSTGAFSTVAHEFEHMIHWWMDYEGDEETWVDEGCADLAIYYCGYGLPASHLYTGNTSNPGFLEEPDHQLTLTGSAWNDPANHVLASYGASFLWTLYLWEHYGGDDTIRALVDEDDNGITGVNHALAAVGAGANFEQVFRQWVVANYLDDGSGAYGYASIQLLASGSSPPSTFPRPKLAASHASYPVNASRSINYWAAPAVKLTGGGGNTLNVTFNGANDNRFAAVLVRSSTANLNPGTNTVIDIPLNASGDGSASVAGMGAGVQAVLLIPASIASSGGKSYSYSATLGASDTPTPTATGTPTPTRTPSPTPTECTEPPCETPVAPAGLFLPLILRALPTPTPTPEVSGINGRVTYHGSPAAGLELELRFYSGSSWSTRATTTTRSDGRYGFSGVPGLGNNQIYYVLYSNPSDHPNPGPNYLYSWSANKITSYSAGATVAGGDFDVADVPLGSPDGASIWLPYRFSWTRRGIAGDGYWLAMFYPGGNKYGESDPLGDVSSFDLGGLPGGWPSGATYYWWVDVYEQGSEDYNFGAAYDTHTVKIYYSAAGAQGLRLELRPFPGGQGADPKLAPGR